jgi:hypothetical protein
LLRKNIAEGKNTDLVLNFLKIKEQNKTPFRLLGKKRKI